jgi:serine phosphatase RsbU (regulator of sigma subunit)
LLEEQNKKILQSKKEIEIQKAKLESRNQTITDSIEYAKSIQDGIMNRNSFQENIPNSFVFFKPKDIVSGDFYWYTRIEDKDIIALIDCTGHGVAGAFMTVIGNSLMNQIVVEHNITDPSAILKQLDKKVMEILRQKEVRTANHSMDIALCKIDHTEKTLTFAGAKRPLYIVRNGGFEEIKGDKYTVGEYNDTPYKEFENNVIPLTAETTFYLCSDGYADQFGEKVQKKYMIKRLKRLLQTVSSKSLDNQHKSLELEMDRWKGIMEQTDDMLVIGFQVCGD